ncbi:hypothetical protein HPB50_001932 [Hyalomma asiaticum]|uniref:Uncharacterized protein n=1 Tax=Hyalomma asiaticum TaxID=266040 RepID=A0ACB7TAF6_HYAAI|nr:hypothetical protein HPB50_001932 [Hyalomma asiaticum]
MQSIKHAAAVYSMPPIYILAKVHVASVSKSPLTRQSWSAINAYLIALCSTRILAGNQKILTEAAHRSTKPRACLVARTSAYHSVELTTHGSSESGAKRLAVRAEPGCLPSSVAAKRISFWTLAKRGCAVGFKDAALVRVCVHRSGPPSGPLGERSKRVQGSAPAS